jgi:hypothetical protein
MYNVGELVAFFDLDQIVTEEIELRSNNNVEDFIKQNIVWYKVVSEDDTSITIQDRYEDGKEINVPKENYNIYTKEQLRMEWLTANNKNLAICNKIKQLYRKHNYNHGSAFQFQGV